MFTLVLVPGLELADGTVDTEFGFGDLTKNALRRPLETALISATGNTARATYSSDKF